MERECWGPVGGSVYTSVALSLTAGIYGVSFKAGKWSCRIISTFSTTEVILKLNCWLKLSGEACGNTFYIYVDYSGDYMTL